MPRSRIRDAFVFFGSLALAAAANAAITIDQVYSNFDGTIQYVVLTRAGEPLPSLAGRTLVATDGATSKTYTFPGDLVSDRNHPRVLVATQRFASLGKVAPDYVLPENFLPLAHGSVALDDAVLDYGGSRLPADGWHAIYRDPFTGSIAAFVAAASNSHGDAYAFTRKPALTGLWWNAAEPGWGLAVEQQGDALFAVWATHDADGAATWYYVVGVPVVDDFLGDLEPVDGLWKGTLYASNGPPASAPSYDANRVGAREAGAIELSFPVGPATAGSFQFVLDGRYGEKTFTRAVFGDPVRQCFLDPAVVPRAGPNHQGLWWNPAEPGWALQVNHQGDAIFAIWFTYDDAGRATWLSFAAQRATDERYAGTLYRTTSGSSAVINTVVGTASVAFTDAGHATFAFEMNGTARTKAIEREQLAASAPICE
jgi:hypothetical protein